MPGGTGHLFSASGVNGNTHLNNRGDVVFNATLDTSTGGVADTGLYQWSHGQLSVIARTGTVIPGVGTIAAVTNPSAIVVGPPAGVFPTSGAVNNDRGQVIFAVTLTEGTGVMLLYTPSDAGSRASTAAAVTSAHTGPAAVTDLSVVTPSLLLSGPATAPLAEAGPTSGPANPGATAGTGSAVVLPPPATTSPAAVSFFAAKRAHNSAVDDFFTLLPEGPLNDPLG